MTTTRYTAHVHMGNDRRDVRLLRESVTVNVESGRLVGRTLVGRGVYEQVEVAIPCPARVFDGTDDLEFHVRDAVSHCAANQADLTLADAKFFSAGGGRHTMARFTYEVTR